LFFPKSDSFCNGPDYQRLAAPHISGGKNFFPEAHIPRLKKEAPFYPSLDFKTPLSFKKLSPSQSNL